MPKRFRFRSSFPAAGARASILAPEVADGTATLRLFDPIDDWGGDWGVSAKEFATALVELPEGVDTIHLHINSPGGMVFEGITILNQLRQHPARVVAIVDGLAASAASFIACGVDELRMAPNTQLMVHDAWGLAIGDAATMRETAELLDRLSDNIASVYAAKTSGTVEEWRTAMLAESWYSADEAVAAGLADSVVGQAPEGDATAAFDMTSFRFAGRDEAPTPILTSKAGFPGRLRDRAGAIATRHRLH